MINLTYCIIRFPDSSPCEGLPKRTWYVGKAWNRDHAFLLTTLPKSTYSLAHQHLLVDVMGRSENLLTRYCLTYFDGEYVCDTDGNLWPVKDPLDADDQGDRTGRKERL